MTRRVALFMGLLLLILSAVFIPAQPARAATLTAGNAAELIAAVNTANIVAGADTIVLTATITLTTVEDTAPGRAGLPPITSDITIQGQGYTITRGAGAPTFRIVRVTAGGILTLNRLIVSNGNAKLSNGGGIWNGSTLNISNSTLSNNSADEDGGGVHNEGGTVTISNSTLSGNTASTFGGGVENEGGTVTISNSTLSGNTASTFGGGVENDGGSLNISNSTLSGNTADDGGGVDNDGGMLTISNSTLSGNSASRGGGVNIDGGTLTISNSTLSGNSASEDGGGVYNVDGDVTISSSSLAGNTASEDGGGIRSVLGTLTVSNSTLSGNAATSYDGGGVYNAGGTFTATNSTFSANSAARWGGAILNTGTLTMTYSTLSGNEAGVGGGVNNLGSATISNSIIANSPVGGNCAGAITSSFSLSNDGLCDGFTISASAIINLAPLADNGGSTRTHALNLDSSALDSSDPFFCTLNNPLDQRGGERGVDGIGSPDLPQPGDCDIGAFERGVTIHTLQFAAANSSLTPGAVTTVRIPVMLDAPLPTGYGLITAYLWVSGGTAVEGTDYALFGVPTVTFNPGDQTKNITLNLLNAGLTADRTVIVSIATTHGPGFSGPARLGALTSHTVTLKASLPSAAPIHEYYGTRDVTLTWAGVSWATGYEIQVDNEISFAAPRVAESSTIPVGTLFYDVTVPGNGTFYWRVRALGGAVAWSPVQSFVVAGT